MPYLRRKEIRKITGGATGETEQQVHLLIVCNIG
jgi:hypothetical protein